MPRQETVITIFVASPNDVVDERNKLEEVIRELNLSWSRTLEIRIELIRWETYAFPGVGSDSQAVINDQMPSDYDCFIAILWHRFGTPTRQFGSGTEEEFRRAKSRYDTNPSSLSLMVYFKDEPIPPSAVDPAELIRVNEFRNSLGEEGVLYWKFNSLVDFERLVRLHLTRFIQLWRTRLPQDVHAEGGSKVVDADGEPAEQGPVDDLGILDLAEIAESQFAELVDILERMGAATKDLGSRVSVHAAVLVELSSNATRPKNRQEAKRLISRAAADMDQYATRLSIELPLFHQALNAGMNAFVRGASMSIDLTEDERDAQQLVESLSAIVSLRETFLNTLRSMNEFRKTIASLPRMTSELNKAKRNVTRTLDQLIGDLVTGQRLVGEAEGLVRDRLSSAEH